MFKEILNRINNNLLPILILLLIIITAPQWFGAFAAILLIPILLLILPLIFLAWRFYRAHKRASKIFEQMYREEQRGHARQQESEASDDGRVTIITSERNDRRVNDDVGEYVDFKEIKEKK